MKRRMYSFLLFAVVVFLLCSVGVSHSAVDCKQYPNDPSCKGTMKGTPPRHQCHPDQSSVKRVVVPDRQDYGKPQGVFETEQFDSCGTNDVGRLSNSLVCFGPPVDDCQNTVEIQYANTSCPPGKEAHDGACWICPGITVSQRTIGTSWYGNGQCKGSFAGKDYFINAVKSDEQCSPPPPLWGNNRLKLTPNASKRSGKCFAKYCTKTKVPTKILSCARPPESHDSKYPGSIVFSSNSATCKVADGIVKSQFRGFDQSICVSPTAGTLANIGAYCTFQRYVYDSYGGECCSQTDYYMSGTSCTVKIGTAVPGYYRPYSSNSPDVLGPLIQRFTN